MNESTLWIGRLADKWHEIPMTLVERGSSIDQMRLPDAEFLGWWNALEKEMLSQQIIYWTVEVYRDFVRGKKIIEVGPGAGVISIQFLREGANITFMDVAEPNLMLINRVCQLKGIKGASFLTIRNFSDPMKVANDYDAVFAFGSLHHTPSEIAKPEFEALASRIKIGGRFVAHQGRKQAIQRMGERY